MPDDFLRALIASRRDIHARWEILLRIERVNTPLANPDALVFLIGRTLDEVFAVLRVGGDARASAAGGESARPGCACGRNPLLAYFAAGEQALAEGLVLAQAGMPALLPAPRDAAFAELHRVLRRITRREIEAFCGVCQFRAAEPRAAVIPRG
ncbi:MAG: hypothetical protein RLZZ15_3583 [Verrucomicrobiota bacterium]